MGKIQHLIGLQRKIKLGTATEEEIAFFNQERDILLYRETKKIDALLAGETMSRRAKPGTRPPKPIPEPPPPPPEPPKPPKKTADMKAYMENYRCEHRAEINAARNERYRKSKLPPEPEYMI